MHALAALRATLPGRIARMGANLFPLAVESEWMIVGQEFRELGPGESMEGIIVSAPDARGLIEEEMTWRVRLRTGINETDVLGVWIADHEIRPER